MSESGLAPVLPAHWRWWEDGAHDGVTNMATDQVLLDHVLPGVGTWRWYGWSQPTVSFGRNERTAGRFPPDGLTEAGLDAVRRPTGGRALLHWRELTYCVTLPLPAEVPWRRAYNAINDVLLAALTTLGIPAHLAGAGQPVIPDGPVCFDRPAEGEITVQGRKLVGSAVWRQGDAYLQHGSLLLHDDQGRLASIPGALAVAPPAAATLSGSLPHLADEDVRRQVYAATRMALTQIGTVTPFAADRAWDSTLVSQHGHFASPEWLWRR
jgi:lipoyl(octanoyl) transferase